MGAKIPEPSSIPARPKCCSCQRMTGRVLRRESVIEVPSQRDIPFARTLSTPATCLAWKHHPEEISRPSSMRVSAANLGSLPPPQRVIQWIADILSPFNRMLSPSNRGRTPWNSTKAHALTTMPSSSRTLMDRSSLSVPVLLSRASTLSLVEIDPPPPSRLYTVSPNRGAGCETTVWECGGR